MKEIIAIVLAAGRGTRMKSDIPKVMHRILGKPILCHILDAVRDAGLRRIITVTGYGSEYLDKAIERTKVVVQRKLLGSADAVNTARKALGRYSGDILIICGDTPLISAATIKKVIDKHRDSGASLTLLTSEVKDPRGYGRIVRDDGGRIAKIVEETETDIYEEVINEINVGTYCCRAEDLFEALASVRPANKKKEYFLTDAVEILRRKGRKIESAPLEDPDEMIGINTRSDLAKATTILKNKILEEVMAEGVTVEDPSSTTIYPGVTIGPETIIHPDTVIESDVEIGRGCRIGPFARLRQDVRIGDSVEIGNFVELVRTKVGDGTKIKHHAYLGDAAVGRLVNVGAGAITANFDGKKKNVTIIEDGAFIGVGAVLIAPVKIGKLAVIGAGCVVPKNRNVPKGATVVGVPARIMKRG